MKIPSWRVWVPTGVAGAAVAALLVTLIPNAGPAAAAPPAAAAQSNVMCTAPLVPAPAASIDYFLKVDGINGGSTDAKHPDEISISSFVWGVNMDQTACSGATSGGSIAAGGGGAGKIRFSEVQFVKTIDTSSPSLAQAVATGKAISRAVLTARKAGGAQQEFLVITLTHVNFTSYSISASAGSLPQDTFDMSYAQINYQFFPQRPDGGLGSPVVFCFNIAAHKNC